MLSYKEYKLLTEEFEVADSPPKKTIKGYKLFRVNKKQKGKLFPLFVDANTPIQQGVWLKAKEGDKNEKGKVKSKLGPLAFRPGWHSGNLPIATHIGEGGTPPKYRPNNQVWAEVEIPNDVDWQVVATNRGRLLKKDSKTTGLKKGEVDPKTAHITDQLPTNGHYKYKTNPNMTGSWIISGEIKVNKILSDEEVEKINKAGGVADLPRKEPLNLEDYGF